MARKRSTSKSSSGKRSSFVYPPGTSVGGKKGKYPINTIKRARAALSYSARKDTVGSYSTVAKAVRAKYGNQVASVGRARGTIARAGYRTRGRR